VFGGKKGLHVNVGSAYKGKRQGNQKETKLTGGGGHHVRKGKERSKLEEIPSLQLKRKEEKGKSRLNVPLLTRKGLGGVVLIPSGNSKNSKGSQP